MYNNKKEMIDTANQLLKDNLDTFATKSFMKQYLKVAKVNYVLGQINGDGPEQFVEIE